MHIFCCPSRGSIRILTAYLVVVGLCAPMPSWAYRPFVSTDAAVADPKEVEIELGYFTLEREKHENSFVIPRTVINYGLVKDWEVVGEFAIRRTPDGEINLIDAALFLKGVLKKACSRTRTASGSPSRSGRCYPRPRRGNASSGSKGSAS